MRLGRIFSYVFGCLLINPQKLRFTIWSSYIMICVKLQWHGFWDVQKIKSRIPIQTVCHSLKKRLNKGRFIWKKHVHLSSSQLRFFPYTVGNVFQNHSEHWINVSEQFGIVYIYQSTFSWLICYPVRHGHSLPRKRTHPRIKLGLDIPSHIWNEVTLFQTFNAYIYISLSIHTCHVF